MHRHPVYETGSQEGSSVYNNPLQVRRTRDWEPVDYAELITQEFYPRPASRYEQLEGDAARIEEQYADLWRQYMYQDKARLRRDRDFARLP